MGQIDNGQYDRQTEVDYVSGAAMLVKRGVLKKIGGMRKELFMYSEETEWAMRMKKAGFKCVYVPVSRIWHKISRASQGRFSPFTIYHYTRNHFYIFRNYPEYRFQVGIRMLLAAANSIRGAVLNRDIQAFVSVIRGFRDGLLGRFSQIERGEVNIVTFEKEERAVLPMAVGSPALFYPPQSFLIRNEL